MLAMQEAGVVLCQSGSRMLLGVRFLDLEKYADAMEVAYGVWVGLLRLRTPLALVDVLGSMV